MWLSFLNLYIFTINIYLFIIWFSWIFKLFNTGQQRDLDVNDVYSTLNEHKSSLLGDELEE